MKAVALKLVFRSWWRNKTFSVISIVSLAIGIACTNLLAVFTIHEYNIETGNPNKKRIWMLSQDSPMKSGEKVLYTEGSVPGMIKEKYTEVEDYLRISPRSVRYVTIGNKEYAPVSLVAADPSLPKFFPCKVLSGDLQEALTHPDKLALTEQTARKLFGKSNPIGQIITFNLPDGGFSMQENADGNHDYQVAAVIEDREQSFLNLEAITGTGHSFFGGPTLLMMNKTIDRQAFEARLKKDKIPTLQIDLGRYYLNTLQESYFQSSAQQSLGYINYRQPMLLYVGLISAILILLIACFNYINLSFSRLLQQTRMVQTQKLMGATGKEISRQLFIDTFLTVMLAFLFSLLITHDLLPVFNSIVGGRLHTAFFFNWQSLPLTAGFILLLAIIPAVYMSRKVSKLSAIGYKEFHTGNRKRRIVTSLSIAQYVISIGLIIATLTVSSQIRFIQKSGENYKNLIEIGNLTEDNSYLVPFARELRNHPEIAHLSLAGSSVLESWIQQVILKNEDGSERYIPQINYSGDSGILDALQLNLQKGIYPEKAIEIYDHPVYINEKFAEILVGKGEDIIGKPYNDNASTIAGIVDNLYTNSLEEEVYPFTIDIFDNNENAYHYIYIRLNGNREKSLATIRQTWDKVNPGKHFTYQDVYQNFLQRNRKATELSQLLLMYSLISIFLTCFGLFGMALYATEQRTKEIGVRKVNGASTFSIMLLLNKQFVIWIGIAFILSIPLAWLFLTRWLEQFAYRTNLSILHFLLGGIIVLIVTLLTVSWHTYRAASGNPVDSLKDE